MYVADIDQGVEALSPDAFAANYYWQNSPARASGVSGQNRCPHGELDSLVKQQARQTRYGGMEYRCVATSVAGFVQQLVSCYLPHGYWFYVSGLIPRGKDPASIDQKLLAKRTEDRKTCRHCIRYDSAHRSRIMPREEEWDRIIIADMERLLGDAVLEKREEVNRIIAELGLHWGVDHDDAIEGIRATPETRTITISIPCVNRQLAMAFGYVKCYRAVVRIAQGAGRVVPWPECDEQFAIGLQYLGWAMGEHVRALAAAEQRRPARPEIWMAELPMPDPAAPADTDDRVALELYYMALAVDLHHELWHIRCRHTGRKIDEKTLVVDRSAEANSWAVEQEIEADVGAAEYLLDTIGHNEDMFSKRLLGVALSLLYDTFLELEGCRADDDHQPYIARLWNRIGSHTDDPNHISWAVVGVAISLALGLTNRPRAYDRHREFSSFREAADYIMNVYNPPQ